MFGDTFTAMFSEYSFCFNATSLEQQFYYQDQRGAIQKNINGFFLIRT